MWRADRKICLSEDHCLAPRGFAEWCQTVVFFLSAPNNQDALFFMYIFWSPAFDCNVAFDINESRSYTMKVLKVDVVCEVAMTSTPNVLTPELRDLLHNQKHVLLFVFFIYPTGRISVCKISCVSTGKIAENLVWYARNNYSDITCKEDEKEMIRSRYYRIPHPSPDT